MPEPRRIQRKRTKGYRAPQGAVYVGRPTAWGNQYSVDIHGREGAVEKFRDFMQRHPSFVESVRRELAGRDLLCWCAPDAACHADLLLAVARGEEP